ncbi:MAG: acetoacetate decarboxylase family protein [Mastigocoleus sp. MO_167.B18]|nr:acetoacetate decarboxylase family protein [Mastigocoleus sp. MO_167.B18]
MTYPPAPWRLQGFAIQSLNLVDSKVAKDFVPSQLEIVSFLPGKTLGGIYVSSYKSGSLLEYNELIVVPGYVRYQGKAGFWISHIYVDNEDSVAGGREIWGLPKEMAEFSWDKNSVTISQTNNSQSNNKLCNLEYNQGLFNLPIWWKSEVSGSCFSGLSSDLLFFTSQFKSKIALIKSNLEIPTSSPFAPLNLGKPILTLNLQDLELVAGVPKTIKNTEPQTQIHKTENI